MNEVKCKIKDCSEVFRTEEPVSDKVRFVCKKHPRSVQLRAVGRSMKKKDNSDVKVKFQSSQFDPNIRR